MRPMEPDEALFLPTQKSVRLCSIDVIRIIAMLVVILCHMGTTSKLLQMCWGLFDACSAVVYFMFVSALFAKKDVVLSLKRAAWILAGYIFWSFLYYFLLWPFASSYNEYLCGAASVFQLPSIMEAPYSEILALDYTQKFPGTGHLWFIRLLAVLTILTPFLLKLGSRLLVVLALGFFCIRYSPLMDNGIWSASLPFVLTEDSSSLCCAGYVAGLVVNLQGGLRAFYDFCLKHFLLLMVPVIIVCMQLVLIVSGIEMNFLNIIGQEFRVLVPICLCALFCRFEPVFQRLEMASRISALASGVFVVYVLHALMLSIIGSVEKHILHYSGGLEVYEIFKPLLVFLACYCCFFVLRRIPHGSMILCFVPGRKNNIISRAERLQ